MKIEVRCRRSSRKSAACMCSCLCLLSWVSWTPTSTLCCASASKFYKPPRVAEGIPSSTQTLARIHCPKADGRLIGLRLRLQWRTFSCNPPELRLKATQLCNQQQHKRHKQECTVSILYLLFIHSVTHLVSSLASAEKMIFLGA